MQSAMSACASADAVGGKPSKVTSAHTQALGRYLLQIAAVMINCRNDKMLRASSSKHQGNTQEMRGSAEGEGVQTEAEGSCHVQQVVGKKLQASCPFAVQPLFPCSHTCSSFNLPWSV